MARVVPLLVLVLALAGCGGGEAVQDLGEAAKAAPADARAFVAVRTDGDAEQTRRAVELLARFPAFERLEVDLEREVVPALGEETALVTLSGGEQVVLTQPDDRGRLDELLGRVEERPVTREVEGWTAIAQDEAALDAFERARERGSLADGESFREAFDEVPGDGVVRAWTSERGDPPLRGLVAAIHAEEEGFRVEGARDVPEDGVEPFAAELLDRVPAGAAVVASFRGRAGLAERLRMLPLPSVLGLEELGDLLEGEGVLSIRAAALVPELTLLTEVEDEEAAARAAETLLRRLGATPQGPDAVQFGPLTVRYGARDGVLAVTTSAAGLEVLEPADDSFREDPRFERAAERAEMPDETTGFIFVRGDELAQMLGLLGVLGGEAPPAELRANVERLGSVLLYGDRDGERHTFAGFVEILDQ